MIVERYLEWATTAPAHLKAETAGALARSYLYGDLEPAVRRELAEVLLRSLDDPALSVRCAIAEAFATSADAPRAVVLALAQDAADAAEPVVEGSPLLGDSELIDLAAQGGPRLQRAIARRLSLSAAVSAALAEIGSAAACETLLRNTNARITRSALVRVIERHADDRAVREALLAHPHVGADLRQMLMRSVAATLQAFVAGCGWLQPDRARRATEEACDRGALSIASRAEDLGAFVLHLAGRGEFSTGFALRALLSGNLALFEAALTALSGQSPRRVAGFVRDHGGRGFEAVFVDAGFPRSALPVFRAALSAGHEYGFPGSANEDAALSRRMVERALTACEGAGLESAPLLALLRRFAVEAAREDARRAYPLNAPRSAEAA